LRKSTAKRIKRRLRALPDLLAKCRITAEQYRSTLASIHGWLKWSNSRHFQLHLNLDQLHKVIDHGGQPKTVC